MTWDFWTGLGLGLGISLAAAIIIEAARLARDIRKFRAQRERQQAPLHVPDKSLAELVRELQSAETVGKPTPDERRASMRVVSTP